MSRARAFCGWQSRLSRYMLNKPTSMVADAICVEYTYIVVLHLYFAFTGETCFCFANVGNLRYHYREI